MGAESKVEKYLRAEVALLGGWMEKHTSPGTRGPPDNDVMWPRGNYNAIVAWQPAPVQREDGTSVRAYVMAQWPMLEFIETKAPNGRLTVLQKRDHERRRAMGFLVHVLWNFELAEAYLRSRGKR